LLKVYLHRWFLVGHSPAHPGLSVFALDRIDDCIPTSIRYVPTSVDFSTHFQHVIGPTVAPSRLPETVHLRFSRGRAPYVRTKPLHCSQRILSNTPAGLELTLYLIPNPELITQLLSFGPDVEVLAPASVRTAILKRLRASLARYEAPADAGIDA
jgi:predicted DNA-binding transcriptional regulator YafY